MTRRFATLLTATAIALALLAPSAATAASTLRPHMGSEAADQGTIYWDALSGHNLWAVNTWKSVCRRLVYYYIDASVPSTFRTAVASRMTRFLDSTRTP